MRRRWTTIVAVGMAVMLTGALIRDYEAAGGDFDSGATAHAFDLAGAMVGAVLGATAEHLLDDASSPRMHLRVPEHDSLRVAAPPHEPKDVPSGELRAHAYQYVSRVFSRPAKHPHAKGIVRRGMVLRAQQRVPGPGCAGAWYAIGHGSVVCSSEGFAVSRTPREPFEQPRPKVARALPYVYAKVTTPGALRFHRIPTEDEERAITRALEEKRRLPDVVDQRMRGVYLLALDRQERAGERLFHRTVRGRYVRAEDIERKQAPEMRGELLGADNPLPFAFVYGQREEPATVYQLADRGDVLKPVGLADNHARLPVERELSVDDQAVVVDARGLALLRSQVRVARQTERPDDVPENAKWIHVDLEEQTLIAYEGDQPVFATLVSSGKGEDFATPTGLYRIDEKHISTTMRGPDPDEGVYEVGEVPWTMFYDEGYALHGAYWHNGFGNTRSHGCTNISPIDARWLFYWSDGELPRGWHALRSIKGTYVYLTGAAAHDGPAT